MGTRSDGGRKECADSVRERGQKTDVNVLLNDSDTMRLCRIEGEDDTHEDYQR